MPFLSFQANANVGTPPQAQKKTCGFIKEWKGDLEILGANRSYLIKPKKGKPLPCESWISVKKGWVKIRHRLGYMMTLSEGTFVELYGKKMENRVTLYQGEVFMQSYHGGPSPVVVTPNAYMTIDRGMGMLSFDQDIRKSQMVMLDHQGTLKNRFLPKAHVTIKAGESSHIDLSYSRNTPKTPRVVKIDSLKTHLHRFQLDKSTYALIFDHIKERENRNIASTLPQEVRGRSIASETKVYDKNKKEKNEKAQEVWLKRVVGGEKQGVPMLYPKKMKVNKREIQFEYSSESRKKEKQKVLEKLSEMRNQKE